LTSECLEKQAGSSNCERPNFTKDDFRHVRISEEGGDDAPGVGVGWPSDTNPSYHIELYRHDYVLMEFVSRNDASSACEFPAERRFEILPFDEGIYWDGEEEYSPAKYKRPPTLCDNVDDARSIELPGHFSNHACGSSATVYDTFRLRTDVDDSDDDAVICAPTQSAAVQSILKNYTTGSQNSQIPEEDPLEHISNVMTTHRPLPKGTEVLTDYALCTG